MGKVRGCLKTVLIGFVVVMLLGVVAAGCSGGASEDAGSAGTDAQEVQEAAQSAPIPEPEAEVDPEADQWSAAGSAAPKVVEPVAEPAPAPAPEQTPVSGTLKVTYIDVGQGDSELVQFPDGRTMLIDAGTYKGGPAAVRTLQALGVSRIDYLVATHPHADHIGGMKDVLAAFDVGSAWTSAQKTTTATYTEAVEAVEAKGLTIQTAAAGTAIASGDGWEVTALWPPAGAPDYEDLNDCSLVLRLDFGGTSFLFTGDLHANYLRDAVRQTGHVDVLKVAHHGSETGTDAALVSALTPSVAVLSYGADNDYGHPDQAVLDALQAGGVAQVFGTGVNGTVTVTSDGSSVTATPEREGTVAAGKIPDDVAQTYAEALEAQKALDSGTAEESDYTRPQYSDTGKDLDASGDADDEATMVYVSTGASAHSYHASRSCSALKKSKNVVEETLAEAKSQGRDACGRCHPPE